MSFEELEAQVQQTRQHWQATLEKRATREEHMAAWEAALHAEQALALAKGEETALACDWAARWDTGALLPHVVASGYKLYLLYIVREPDPAWDGTYVHVMRTSETQTIAVVEFLRYESFRFGGPNDEVFSGHPLWGKGLDPYRAHMVANSRWLAELEQINSVHSMYRPAKWRALQHYLLLFHDETFECLAQDYTLEVVTGSMADVVKLMTERLLAHG